MKTTTFCNRQDTSNEPTEKVTARKKRRLYPSEHIESANVHDEAHVYSVKLTSIDTTHSFLKYTRVSPCVLSKAYNH